MADHTTPAKALSPARSAGFGEWVRFHDEKWSFVVLYLGLAIGLSVFVSLFWLLVVAGLHFLLECGRQAHYRSGTGQVVGHALWEVKLDIGLVLLALTLVLYIEVVMGLLGLQSAARAAAVSRAGARIGSRAAAWERNIRTFLLTVDEMARLVYGAVMVRRGRRRERRKGRGTVSGEAKGAAVAAPAPVRATAPARHTPGAGWRGRWGMADRIGLLLVAAGIILLLAAPFLTHHDWTTALAEILAELRPFPA